MMVHHRALDSIDLPWLVDERIRFGQACGTISEWEQA